MVTIDPEKKYLVLITSFTVINYLKLGNPVSYLKII